MPIPSNTPDARSSAQGASSRKRSASVASHGDTDPVQTLAISYSRWSDPQQSLGDSERRQAELFAAFCERHGLTPARDYTFTDRGLSGYTGQHRRTGQLGELLRLAEAGTFPRGTTVVIEAWDRLGRLRPERQIHLVSQLLYTGLRIGVVRLNDLFVEADLGTHKWTILSVFAQLAYEESRQKSERVSHAWRQDVARARAAGTPTRFPCPAWVERRDGKYYLVPERAAVVRVIFDLAKAGYGLTRIVGRLTAAQVPPWGECVRRVGRRRSQWSGQWTRSYVRRILTDRRAVGEYHPHKRDRSKAREEGVEAIAGFFPPVVSEEDYLLARAAAAARQGPAERATRRSTYLNVFTGLLRDARTGEGWLVDNKGSADLPHLVLVPYSAKSGRGTGATVPYEGFERAVLSCLREVPVAAVAPAAPTTDLDSLRLRLDALAGQIALLLDDLRLAHSPGLSALLREKEAEHDRLSGELDRLRAERLNPLAEAWGHATDLALALDAAADPEDARLRLRAALRRAIASVWLLVIRRGLVTVTAAQVWFHSGSRRDYLVVYVSGRRGRPAAWSARSLATVPSAGELDLRDRADAARLEAVLAALDLADLPGLPGAPARGD